MLIKNKLCLAVFLAILCTEIIAGPEKYLKKGYIKNDSGNKCWYSQETKKAEYFHGETKGTIGIMTFDNPECMSDSGVGLDTNKMMINNIISKWYSHSDAKFLTRPSEMFSGSLMQKKGQCIQSKTYSGYGIVVDYTENANSITQVRHGISLGACSN